jgi:hypothetical protein
VDSPSSPCNQNIRHDIGHPEEKNMRLRLASRKKPIDAIDKFIRDTKKVKAKEDDVFNPWEQ